MRRCSQQLCLLVFALLTTGICRAQDAAKIIEQWEKAEGGAKSLAKVQTLLVDGAVQSPGDESSGTYTFRVKLPNRCYTELRSGGKTTILAYNGKSAWHQAESGEIATLLGTQALEMEAAAQYYNARWLNLSKKKIGTSKGTGSLHGHETFQVELTYPTGIQWEVFFDQQSHLIVAEKAMMAGDPQEIYYEDYRSDERSQVPLQAGTASRCGKCMRSTSPASA